MQTDDDEALPADIEYCMDPITDEELNYLADQLFQMLDAEEEEMERRKREAEED